MSMLPNTSLSMPNVSYVYTQQSNYTSMELYAIVFAAYIIFLGYSLYADPIKYVFEKFISALLAFLMAFSIWIASFSLAKISIIHGGTVATTVSPSVGISGETFAILPTIIMQNTQTLSITMTAIGIVTLIYLIHCIIMLKDIAFTKNNIGRLP